MTTAIRIRLDHIEPSKTNPRKTFNEDELQELATSIRSYGVVQPIKVRPHPTKNHGTYELVIGERRLRASKLAGVDDIPAVVEELTETEVLEQQLIENTQRVDVHPLEEAESYQSLLDEHGYTMDSLVSKTGKSRAHLYGRLKLLTLTPTAKKSFLAGKVQPSVAELLARIPVAKLQDQALKEVLGDNEDNIGVGIQHERVSADGKTWGGETQPLSFRAAQQLIQRRYSLKLALATFDIADATLCPAVGACGPCSHRSGNQPELAFPGTAKAAEDLCTNPPCFEQKKKADWDRKAAQATRDGLRVLGDRERKNVFEQYGDGTRVQTDSAYVNPDDKLPYELDQSQRKTWRSIVGTAAPAAALAVDGAGAARTLWDRKSVVAIAKKSGKLKEAKAEGAARAKSTPNEYQDKQRAREKAAKRRRAAAAAALDKIREQALKDPGTSSRFWQLLATSIVRLIDEEGRRMMCKRRDIEAKLGTGAAEKHLIVLATKGTADETRALVVEMIAAGRAAGGTWNPGYGKNLVAACSVFGVDIKKLEKAVVAAEGAKKSKKGPK